MHPKVSFVERSFLCCPLTEIPLWCCLPSVSDVVFDLDVRPFSLYTVVEECKHRLLKSGFVELKEKDSWEVKQEGKVCMCVT